MQAQQQAREGSLGILEVSARPKGSRYGDRGLRCHSSWRWAQFEKDSSGIGGFQSGMGVGEKNLEVENLREGVRKRKGGEGERRGTRITVVGEESLTYGAEMKFTG